MTKSAAQRKPAKKTVGPLRYAVWDALLPMTATLLVALVAGLPFHAAYFAAGAGIIVAVWRLAELVGK